MAADKHIIKIVDKDGNQSEITLPGFALDATQEKLIKSVQALGKLDPKTAKAYEDLIEETKKVVKSTDKGNAQDQKDAKALQDAVETAGEKQVSALRQFRMNFADRVGRDMRDTFVAGGNILTAAITTATVGLAAGAGLLYKTFMDTSEAFRTLAQSGLGSGGATGTEAQEAVANLTRLGLSASEAASMLTSFGRASAVLGKANFSKFVAGIATSSQFASDLGLTLNDAAEFAAEEIEMRQRSMSARMQLDAFTEVSIKENIRLTQAMSSLFGRSMKDIQQAKQDFLTQNAQFAALTLRLPANLQEKAVKEFSDILTIAEGFGGDLAQFTRIILNASSSAVPIADATIQQIMQLGSVGTQFRGTINQLNAELMSGSVNARRTMLSLVDQLAAGGEKNARLLSILEQSGDPMAGMIARAARDAKQGGDQLRNAILGIPPAMDPMIQAGVNVQNALNQLRGSFTTFGLQIMGPLASPVNEFMKALTSTGLTDAQKEIAAEEMKAWERQNRLRSDATDEEIEAYKKSRDAKLKELYTNKRTTTVIGAFQQAIEDVAGTFIKVFFGTDGVNTNAEEFGIVLKDKLIPFINQTAEDMKAWLESLEGNTFGEKLKSAAIGMIKIGLGLLMDAIKATAVAVFTSPAGWALIGLAIVSSLVKSAFVALVTQGVAGLMTRAGTSASSSVSSAGNKLAAVIRRVAGQVQAAARGLGAGGAGAPGMPGAPGEDNRRGRGRGGRGGFLSRIGGKLSVVGIGASIVGGIAADELAERGHTKTASAVDTATNVAGMAGTGAMIGSFFGPAGTLIGGAAGAAAGLGLSVYQNWDTWFGSDEAKEAVAEKGQEAIEGIDGAGMMAMAMDPAHIRAVSAALSDFNKVSVANITAGLNSFNPALTALFNVISQVRTQFIEVVNNKLNRFLTVITGLNAQGAILPITTVNVGTFADKIAAIPVDPIVKLSTAFNALTTALKDFSDLTTSTVFSRMWDSFSQKEDQTASLITTLNDFAAKVETQKITDAAAAISAFNSAITSLARPVEVQRTNVTGAGRTDAAPTGAAGADAMTTAQQNLSSSSRDNDIAYIRSMMNTINTTLTNIKNNTDPRNNT
jgi:hypothetical protein